LAPTWSVATAPWLFMSVLPFGIGWLLPNTSKTPAATYRRSSS
jgi:hypothetical protein